MVRGYDPAAFDIVRQDRERDTRDYRDDRNQERELERDRRQEDQRDTMDDRVQSALETITNDDSVTLSQQDLEAINDPSIRMTRNGELTRRTGLRLIRGSGQFSRSAILPDLPSTRKRRRRKKSAYRRAYEAAFKSCKSRHMTKSGKWKKGGFRRCVAESHKMARKKIQ